MTFNFIGTVLKFRTGYRLTIVFFQSLFIFHIFKALRHQSFPDPEVTGIIPCQPSFS
jgi:hypothetical protein